MASVKPILYNYFRSSSSWRVRIALELKSIEYEYKPVNLLHGQQNSEEYGKINIRNEVPVLQIGNNFIYQSLPIIEYLDETYPQEPRLLPKDPLLRAKARSIAEIINSAMQPYQNLNVLKRVLKDTQSDEKKNQWVQDYLHKGLKALESILKETSGKYCVLDDITIADICLVPQVYSAHRFNVDLTEYPNVRRVYAELEQVAAFRKAHAHRQPDTPDDLREP